MINIKDVTMQLTTDSQSKCICNIGCHRISLHNTVCDIAVNFKYLLWSWIHVASARRYCDSSCLCVVSLVR